MYIPGHSSTHVQNALHEIFNPAMFNAGVRFIYFADSAQYALYAQSSVLGTGISWGSGIPDDWSEIERDNVIRLPKTGSGIAKAINRFQSQMNNETRENPEYKHLLLLGYSTNRMCRIFCCKYMSNKKGSTRSLFDALGLNLKVSEI